MSPPCAETTRPYNKLMDHLLAVVEGAGPVSTTRRNDDGWTHEPLAARGFWPTWHPSGDRLALSTVRQEPDGPRIAIEIFRPGLPASVMAHSPPPGAAAVIAPRIPHYVYWSPAGDTLSFVAPSDDGLALFLSDADGAFTSDRIAGGAPLFSCWRADGRRLAIHAGADLSVLDLNTRRTTTVAENAVGFRSPSYVGETLVYAVGEPPGVALMALDPASDGPRLLRRFAGGVALLERPGTNELAVCVTPEPNTGLFYDLWRTDVREPDAARRIARGPFIAATWSPTGEHIALVVPTQIGDGKYAIHVRDANGAFVAATEGFLPSQDFRIYLGFFDQYAKSHHIWSPAGDALVFTGRLGNDGTAWSFSDKMNDYVVMWQVERNAPLEVVREGDLAFFAHRR